MMRRCGDGKMKRLKEEIKIKVQKKEVGIRSGKMRNWRRSIGEVK
jgi:hypothetical protein